MESAVLQEALRLIFQFFLSCLLVEGRSHPADALRLSILSQLPPETSASAQAGGKRFQFFLSCLPTATEVAFAED